MPSKDLHRSNKGNVGCATLANTTLVHNLHGNVNTGTSYIESKSQQSSATSITRGETPTRQKAKPDGWDCVRLRYLKQGFNSETIDILMSSWRTGTKAGYSKYLKLWVDFCDASQIDFIDTEVHLALNFLTTLHNQGLSYGQINTACSALSAVLNTGATSFGKLPPVKRFMKGIFELKPVFPKYSMIWDVNKIFDYFRSLPSPSFLDLKMLSHKLVMLLMLLSGGQRSQTIHSIKINDIIFTGDNSVVIPIMSKLKQTRPGNHMKPMVFKPYPESSLCVVIHLLAYIEQTKHQRSGDSLLISFIKPHKAVSKDTVARWCKNTMKWSGIDTDKYTTHSSRAAASSKARAFKEPSRITRAFKDYP